MLREIENVPEPPVQAPPSVVQVPLMDSSETSVETKVMLVAPETDPNVTPELVTLPVMAPSVMQGESPTVTVPVSVPPV